MKIDRAEWIDCGSWWSTRGKLKIDRVEWIDCGSWWSGRRFTNITQCVALSNSSVVEQLLSGRLGWGASVIARGCAKLNRTVRMGLDNQTRTRLRWQSKYL